MAAPYIVTTSTKKESAGTTTITITKPTGTVTNDLLVCFVGKDDDPDVASPGGWSNINAGSVATTGPRLEAAYKIATSSEGADYTWTGDSENYYGIMYLVRGYNAAAVINASDLNSGGAAPKSGGPITTNVDDCLILTATVIDDVTVAAPISLQGGLSGQVETDTGGAGGVVFGAGWMNKGTAGEVGQITHNSGGNNPWVGIILAIAPGTDGIPGGAPVGNVMESFKRWHFPGWKKRDGIFRPPPPKILRLPQPVGI